MSSENKQIKVDVGDAWEYGGEKAAEMSRKRLLIDGHMKWEKERLPLLEKLLGLIDNKTVERYGIVIDEDVDGFIFEKLVHINLYRPSEVVLNPDEGVLYHIISEYGGGVSIYDGKCADECGNRVFDDGDNALFIDIGITMRYQKSK